MSKKVPVLLISLLVLTGLFVWGKDYLVSRTFPKYRFKIKNQSKNIEKEIVPNSPLDWQELSIYHLSRANYDEAEKAASKSLQFLPLGNEPSKMVLARVKEARHDFKGSMELAKEGLGGKTATEALSILVSSHLALGNTSEASRYADELLRLHPSVGNYSLRALVLVAQGRDAEAEYDFRRGLAVEDLGQIEESARARALFARFYIQKAKLDFAEALIKEALRIQPGHAFAVGVRGDLDMARQKYPKAAAYYMEAFTQSRRVLYFRKYAKAKKLNGEKDAANKAFEEAEKMIRRDIAEDRYGHRLELAELLLDRAQNEDVKEALSVASEELKVRQSSEVYLILAKAHLACADTVNAKSMIQGAMRNGIRNSTIYSVASEIEKKLGNLDRANFFGNLSNE